MAQSYMIMYNEKKAKNHSVWRLFFSIQMYWRMEKIRWKYEVIEANPVLCIVIYKAFL
jgi:hypothetical protein